MIGDVQQKSSEMHIRLSQSIAVVWEIQQVTSVSSPSSARKPTRMTRVLVLINNPCDAVLYMQPISKQEMAEKTQGQYGIKEEFVALLHWQD